MNFLKNNLPKIIDKEIKKFISRVSLLAEKNKMHARNIATCLFPTFFVVDPGELLRDGSGLFIEVN